MKKSIITSSYISFILLIVIITLEIILTTKYIWFEGINMRENYAFIAYFIHLPLFIFNLILSLNVFMFYLKNKFKQPYKYLYIILPSLIFYIVCLLYLIWGLLKIL